MSKSTISYSKALKGTSVVGNLGSFDTVQANNLIISGETVSALVNGVQMVGISIIDGTINSTIIGSTSPTSAFFTTINANSDVIFYSSDKTKDVFWDSNSGALDITGNFSLQGCATIGNISICKNVISAINTNDSIYLIPNTLGQLYLNGPINNTTTLPGDYLTNLASGSITFNCSDYISLTSQSSSSSISSFSGQKFNTINGDITLNTETGLNLKSISLINSSGGNVQITSNTSTNIKLGDSIILNNTNTIPILDGKFLVTSIINNNVFTISTGNTFTGLTQNSTTGTFIKIASNNINLNASKFINIPNNIPLVFGNKNNTIKGNTSGIILNTIGDLVLNISGKLIVSSEIILGTSGNNINFDGTTTSINSSIISLNSINTTIIDGIDTLINSKSLQIADPNIIIANYQQNNSDLTDRGIQFRYYNNNSSMANLGWFGYKQSTSKFTLITDALNTNDIFTGIAGKFDIGDITTTSITLQPNSFINVNNGKLLDVNTITGNNLNLVLKDINRLSLLSNGDIYIPNNIPITFGTAGTFIKEGTTANLRLTAANNIFLSTATLGSIVIQPNIKVSFDGTSIGNQCIYSDTFGNLNINTNSSKNILINSGTIIIPKLIPIQFGNSTEIIQGSTNGIFLLSNNSLNLISNSNINISTSTGNIQLNAPNSDIQLYSTSGNIRLLPLSRIVFGINNTSNSIRTNSNGNLSLYGPGTSIINGTIGNLIELKNTSNISLNASSSVNIPTNTYFNIDSNSTRYLISDTNSNLLIVNTIGNILLSSLNTFINNSSTNIINSNTNITSNTLTISGNLINLNTTNVKIIDPILTLANYTIVDIKDRGIEFNYTPNNSTLSKLGWFGYKNSLNQFTFYSDAINTNEIITGTLGQFALGGATIYTSLSFISQGNLNMNNGTISNLTSIINTNSSLNISSNSNFNVSSNSINLTSSKILIPNNSLLSFGNTTSNLNSDTNGNIILNTLNTFVINSNVQINGTMNSVYSTITNYQDPILSIGGVSGPVTNDMKDRGIEFKWNDGISSKTGFFGFQNSSKRFIFTTDDINSNEIVTGSYGNVQFNNGYLNNLDLNCGTISNLSILSGCNGSGMSFTSTTNINLSSANIIIPTNTKLSFTNTSNNLSSDTNGNLILSNLNSTIISSSAILFNTNTNGNGFTNFNINSKVYFGSISSANYLIKDTSSNFNIINSSGDIYLIPNLNVIIPENKNLLFNTNGSKITSDSSNLQLYGNTISINATSTITFNGNVNIAGSLVSVDSGKYILPLGTKQQLSIVNIVNSPKNNNSINITVSQPHYFIIGDSITINNTNSFPVIDGIYSVSQIISSTIFSIQFTTNLVNIGNLGVIYGVLKTYQGKDIGIEIHYWSTVGNTSVTSGSLNYKQAFFGWVNNTQQFTYYSNATIQNNVVTQGILGNVEVNKLYTNNISGFILDGGLIGGSSSISTANLQASGGLIDNIAIGNTIAQTGRFSSLTSNLSTSLQNVTMSSNLNYSIERFTLNSSLANKSPSIHSITTFITIIGVTFLAYGNMPDGITDGQIKTICISNIGIACQYILTFTAGKLITPGTGIPTTLTFKSKGQSVNLMWDSTLSSWILTGGSGAFVS